MSPGYYHYPFKPDFELVWSGQWALNAWQNSVITFLLLLGCVFYAVTKKITFFEVFSQRLEK